MILAERLPVESYLDVGNFHRDHETIRMFPDFTARFAPETGQAWETRAVAPLVTTGEALAAARRMVLDNAPRRRGLSAG